MQVREWGPYRAEWKNLSYEEWSEGCKKFKEAEESDNLTDEQLEELIPGVRVHFFKNGVPIYILRKNNYRTNDDKIMFLEWFPMPDNPEKIVHIFNLEHSEISVIDADTGEKVRASHLSDTFITNYKLFDNNEYLYIAGWCWGPFPNREIFHVPTLLTKNKIEGILIPCEESESLDPPIDIYGFSSCAEFLANKIRYFDEKKAIIAAEKFNKNGRECFLWAVLHPHQNEIAEIIITPQLREKIGQLFEKKLDMLFVKSIGNISGFNLHNDWCFYTNFRACRSLEDWRRRDELAYYVLQIIGCPGFVNPVDIQEIDFRFEVEALTPNEPPLKFVMNIRQTYKIKDGISDTRYKYVPDVSNPLKIEFSELLL